MTRIAFIWQDGPRYDWQWHDGLWAAMKILEKDFEVGYFTPYEVAKVVAFVPDVILFWGAATDNNASKVLAWPFKKKCLLFGGGALSADLVSGWDMVFVESWLDEYTLSSSKMPFRRAFGVNEALFHPQTLPKRYRAVLAGTFAAWKRHDLFAKSVGHGGVAIGIKQDHEKWCYEVCEKEGVRIFEELPRSEIARVINESDVALNTADRWGGGQRLTLEAMACNVPPIVMSDSPKNAEFVQEAGFGVVCQPDVDSIQKAMVEAVAQPKTGREYILSKWTSQHYADALKDGIKTIL